MVRIRIAVSAHHHAFSLQADNTTGPETPDALNVRLSGTGTPNIWLSSPRCAAGMSVSAPPAKTCWRPCRARRAGRTYVTCPSHRRPVCQLNGLRRASATAHARLLPLLFISCSHQLLHSCTSAQAVAVAPGLSPRTIRPQATTAHVLRQPRLDRRRPRNATQRSIAPYRRIVVSISLLVAVTVASC